jgi:hypothetical protein
MFKVLIGVVVMELSACSYRPFEETHAEFRTRSGDVRVQVRKSCTPPDCGMRVFVFTERARLTLYDDRKEHIPGRVHFLEREHELIVCAENRLEGLIVVGVTRPGNKPLKITPNHRQECLKVIPSED